MLSFQRIHLTINASYSSCKCCLSKKKLDMWETFVYFVSETSSTRRHEPEESPPIGHGGIHCRICIPRRPVIGFRRGPRIIQSSYDRHTPPQRRTDMGRHFHRTMPLRLIFNHSGSHSPDRLGHHTERLHPRHKRRLQRPVMAEN